NKMLEIQNTQSQASSQFSSSSSAFITNAYIATSILFGTIPLPLPPPFSPHFAPPLPPQPTCKEDESEETED
ncbi:hypothetical protein PanWU01x14_018590, partial [Parasponia andersonii]